MIFYKTGLVRRVRIHPKNLGGKQDPHQLVRKMLKQDIQDNSFSPEYGYILDRICVEKIHEGFCLPLAGFVEFVVTFEGMLLYPIVGEVVHAVVEMVSDTCIIFRHACVYGVVRSYHLNDQDFFKYEEREEVAESKQNNKENEPCPLTFKVGLFRSQTNGVKVIERGTPIRVRILKRTLGSNGFFLIGSMSSEFLGPLKDSQLDPNDSLAKLGEKIGKGDLQVALNELPLADREKLHKQRRGLMDSDDEEEKTELTIDD